MIKLRINNKSFKAKTILKDSVLELPDKGLFILNGRNGSGKSTLLNIISGLDLHYQGHYEYNGVSIDRKNADVFYQNSVRLLFQTPVFFENETVHECLSRVTKNEEIVKSQLEQLGLIDLYEERIEILSTGEKARIALVRAFLYKPQILLLDEVTANLDESNASIYIKMIKEMAKDTLVIFATHENLDFFDLSDCPVISILDHRFEYLSPNYKSVMRPLRKSKIPWITYFKRFCSLNYKQVVLFIALTTIFLGLGFVGLNGYFNTVESERTQMARREYILNNYEAILLDQSKLSFDEKDTYYHAMTILTEVNSNEVVSLFETKNNLLDKTLIKGNYPKEQEALMSDELYESHFSNRTLPFVIEGRTITGIYETEYDSGVNKPSSESKYHSYMYSFSHQNVLVRNPSANGFMRLIKVQGNEEKLEQYMRMLEPNHFPFYLDFPDKNGKDVFRSLADKSTIYLAISIVSYISCFSSIVFIAYSLIKSNRKELIVSRLLGVSQNTFIKAYLAFVGVIILISLVLTILLSTTTVLILLNHYNSMIGGIGKLFTLVSSVYLYILMFIISTYCVFVLFAREFINKDICSIAKEETAK